MSPLELDRDLTRSFYIRSTVEPLDPSLAPLYVSAIVTQQYLNVALLTTLIYHSIITMDKEAKYFWFKPRNSISIIYFANRYVGLLAVVCNVTGDGFSESRASCLLSDWAGPATNLITIILIDYILLIRVLALYHQDKKLDIFLKSLLGLNAASGLGILIYGNLFQEIIIGSIAGSISICGLSRDPPQLLDTISWVIPMTYGLILLGLALYKAAEYWRMSSGFKGFHLVGVLILDQVIYYGFVISCCILRILDVRILSINAFVGEVLNAAGSPTLLCVLGGQLLINLKEAGEMGVNEGTSYRERSMSDIEFS